jgi:lysophospholipase L1-like esterase
MSRSPARRTPARVWRAMLFVGILAGEFAVIEAALRWHGGSEAAPGFQSLFLQDPALGIHRLAPGARTRFTTREFDTEIAINDAGVRDDEPLGPKGPGERRVFVLGDSLVLSVQVPFEATFCERLEARLNEAGGPGRWRVVNGGVQGYGPIESRLLFERLADRVDPDVVLFTIFVGNDALEAADAAQRLEAGGSPLASAREDAVRALRRVVRRSMVLQIVRLRAELVLDRFGSGRPAPERPLATYLADPPPEVARGLAAAADAVGAVARLARRRGAAAGIVLMPARFQLDDGDYGRLAAAVRAAGGTLVRDAATERFARALAPLGLPTLDLLPVLRGEPDPAGLFFQENVHLTPRGHRVVGDALARWLEAEGLVGAGAGRQGPLATAAAASLASAGEAAPAREGAGGGAPAQSGRAGERHARPVHPASRR